MLQGIWVGVGINVDVLVGSGVFVGRGVGVEGIVGDTAAAVAVHISGI